MLDAASQKLLADFGIDYAALSAAISDPIEKPYAFAPKLGEIKIGDKVHHIYDTDGHAGLIGRVKQETLAQSTELGVKAVAAKAGVDYTGNDPVKLLEAVTTKLKLPIDQQIVEKQKDIDAFKKNWEDEKAAHGATVARLKDREELERDISFFPDNRIKTVKDRTLRAELKDDGITFGEFEGKPAVFKNGEVQKNTDRTLVDPKTFTAEHFKTRGWIAPDAVPPTPPKKTTFDGPRDPSAPKPAFNHDTAYQSALKAGGGVWNEKAQAHYTETQMASA